MHLPLKPQLKSEQLKILFHKVGFHQETISLLCALNSPKEQYWFIVPIFRNLDLNKQETVLWQVSIEQILFDECFWSRALVGQTINSQRHGVDTDYQSGEFKYFFPSGSLTPRKHAVVIRAALVKYSLRRMCL